MSQPNVSEKVRHLTVSWDKVDNVSYEVYWQPDPTKKFTLLVATSDTSYTLNTLETGSAY